VYDCCGVIIPYPWVPPPLLQKCRKQGGNSRGKLKILHKNTTEKISPAASFKICRKQGGNSRGEKLKDMGWWTVVMANLKKIYRSIWHWTAQWLSYYSLTGRKDFFLWYLRQFGVKRQRREKLNTLVFPGPILPVNYLKHNILYFFPDLNLRPAVFTNSLFGFLGWQFWCFVVWWSQITVLVLLLAHGVCQDDACRITADLCGTGLKLISLALHVNLKTKFNT